MVIKETILNVADNSGARKVKVFNLYGGSRRNASSIGDICLASVQEALPNGKVKKGDVVRVVIVRTKYPVQRADGSLIRFDDNACVLIDADNNPIGTRVFGPVAREVREAGVDGFMKIVSLAVEVL